MLTRTEKKKKRKCLLENSSMVYYSKTHTVTAMTFSARFFFIGFFLPAPVYASLDMSFYCFHQNVLFCETKEEVAI